MKLLALIALILTFSSFLQAQDPGMQSIGSMTVRLLFATDDDPSVAGEVAKEVPAEEIKRLQAIKDLKFSHYRLMGSDTPDILKGYESWATPLRPSKEILVSFQPIQRVDTEKVQMVLEYWQSKRKIFSANPTLATGKDLYLLGPKWREGRLILAVRIESLKKP